MIQFETPHQIFSIGVIVFTAGIFFLFFSTNSIVIPVTLFVLSLSVVFIGLRYFLLMQKIANIPTSKVEAAVAGMIELCGKAKPVDNMSSPISHVRCAQWRVVFKDYDSNTKGVQLLEIKSQPRFILEDETGRMLIDSTGANVKMHTQSIYFGYISGKGMFGMQHEKMDQKALDFINSLDDKTKEKVLRHQDRKTGFLEICMLEDDNVFVFGNAEPVNSTTASVNTKNLIVKKGGSANTIIISETGERGIVSNLKLVSFVLISEGLAFSVLYLYIILHYIYNW